MAINIEGRIEMLERQTPVSISLISSIVQRFTKKQSETVRFAFLCQSLCRKFVRRPSFQSHNFRDLSSSVVPINVFISNGIGRRGGGMVSAGEFS